ncbi:putative ABC transporter permease [Oscillospiraceae bacterium OttesenSCG-928-F05]|nr:putative ABC transporter permease [Oscillospiraceae bacterium OttesenSCG-928-F05]
MILGRLVKTLTLWLWGGFIYYLIEMAWRGYSHPSMFIVGGICFVLLGCINEFIPWEMGLLWQAVIGALVVTLVEFVGGCIINIWLGLGVWDYSGLPLNILGQICLPYTALWIPLSAVGIWLDDFLRWKLYGDKRPQYSLF